jgi:hypothetical protein
MDHLGRLVVGLCTVDVLVVGRLGLVVVLCIEDGLVVVLCLVVVRLDRLVHPFLVVGLQVHLVLLALSTIHCLLVVLQRLLVSLLHSSLLSIFGLLV